MMSPTIRGASLAIADTAVIALGMSGLDEGHHRAEIAFLVFCMGTICGVPVGMFAGWLAGRTAHLPVAARWLVLAAAPILLVAALAFLFQLFEFFVVACIPTLVAVAILERTTRKVEPPPVPVARI